MNGDMLRSWLDAGLSLTEIGALTNRDPSTVGYWVEKHGLVANGREKYAPRGGLTKDQLEPLIEAGCTQAEIAAAVDRSLSTVRHWLKRYGLKTRHRGGPKSSAVRERVEAAVGNGAGVVVAECPRHGETEFAIVEAARLRIRCRRCRSEAVARRRRR